MRNGRVFDVWCCTCRHTELHNVHMKNRQQSIRDRNRPTGRDSRGEEERRGATCHQQLWCSATRSHCCYSYSESVDSPQTKPARMWFTVAAARWAAAAQVGWNHQTPASYYTCRVQPMLRLHQASRYFKKNLLERTQNQSESAVCTITTDSDRWPLRVKTPGSDALSGVTCRLFELSLQ